MGWKKQTDWLEKKMESNANRIRRVEDRATMLESAVEGDRRTQVKIDEYFRVKYLNRPTTAQSYDALMAEWFEMTEAKRQQLLIDRLTKLNSQYALGIISAAQYRKLRREIMEQMDPPRATQTETVRRELARYKAEAKAAKADLASLKGRLRMFADEV